ncbi:MAG: serine/threonine protein kinase [Planctomycetaceae bacterium]|nr:serine/threonine protein kinase [Planctomycetaceae bacterium]
MPTGVLTTNAESKSAIQDGLTEDASVIGGSSCVKPVGDLQTPQRRSLRYHAGVLLAILVTGLILERVIISTIATWQSVPFAMQDFLVRHTATILVGFGIVFYLCYLNRELYRQIRQQEQLGPYRLFQLIGSGGMGDVYLGEHQLLKRRCAIKLIRKDKASDRRMLARFEREVKATAKLTHWNTVQVYDYGRTADGVFYYAMEYLEGLNLRQLVDRYGPQPPGRVVYILRQICGALHESGQYGLVHRDIKPSNIFLAERGQMYDVAKLLDFGLVLPASMGNVGIRSVSTQLQGSPRFMCPEQAQGLKPDIRGDLYSLACVAYFLLTGRAPFEDDNPVMLVVAHATASPPTFQELGVAVPEDLAEIILRCLHKKPECRFGSARELQEALEACSCASDWSWKDAETWWRSNPDHTSTLASDQTVVSSETQPTPGTPFQDPDQTFVCEKASVFSNIF